MPNLALIETKQIKVQGAEKSKIEEEKTEDGRRGNRPNNRKVKGTKEKTQRERNTVNIRAKGTELKEENANKGTGEKAQKEIQRRKKGRKKR